MTLSFRICCFIHILQKNTDDDDVVLSCLCDVSWWWTDIGDNHPQLQAPLVSTLLSWSHNGASDIKTHHNIFLQLQNIFWFFLVHLLLLNTIDAPSHLGFTICEMRHLPTNIVLTLPIWILICIFVKAAINRISMTLTPWHMLGCTDML